MMKEFKLGRLWINKEKNKRWLTSLLFKNYVKAVKVPEESDFEDAMSGHQFPVLDQDGVGACTIFACATAQMRFEYLEQLGKYPVFGFNELLPKYYKIKVPNGDGAYLIDAVDLWTHEGLDHSKFEWRSFWIFRYPYRYKENYRIQNYVRVNTRSMTEFKRASYIHGNLIIGLLLTEGFLNACREGWRAVTVNDADSEIVGGHAMNCVGYNKLGILVNHTWAGGQKQLVTWDYCKSLAPYYNVPLLDEAFGVVDAENSWLRKFYDFDKFFKDLESVRKTFYDNS